MTDKKNLGNRGELLAKKYLIDSGYKILANNYRYGHLEIDLIAKNNREYIFIEIKTRINHNENKNEIPLSVRQTKNIKRAICGYCYKYRINPESARFDLIVILVSSETNQAKINHYENIF